MATIDITRSHALPIDEAKKRTEVLARKIDAQVRLSWRWDGDTLRFETLGGAAKGLKGAFAVSDKDIHVTIDLPLLLRVMKGSIEGQVNEALTFLLR